MAVLLTLMGRINFAILAIALCPGAAVAAESDNATQEEAVILTPTPPATPRINGPTIFAVRPGHPFLFTIPATGQRPMEYAVNNLPTGLKVDSRTGQISGSLKAIGNYVVTFRVTNALGQAERKFKIVCGDTLALTPQEVWVKDREDGSRAVGLFNRGESEATVTVKC